MELQNVMNKVWPLVILLGSKIVLALAVWLGGKFLISFVKKAVAASMRSRHVDTTFSGYVESAVGVLLNLLLFLSILGVFGVQTTTFAGLLAAAGATVGLALSGLLSNFAAGLFLVVLRPFRRGDEITAAGFTGKVESIGLFVTTLLTGNNVRTYIGNGKLFSDAIQNYSASDYRVVHVNVPLHAATDCARAIELVRGRLMAVAHVLASPAPVVEIAEFAATGPVLTVRPACKNEHHGQVFFETTRLVREELARAGLPLAGG